MVSPDIKKRVAKHTRKVGQKTWYERLNIKQRKIVDEYLKFSQDNPGDPLSAVCDAMNEHVGLNLSHCSFRRFVQGRAK